MGRHDLPRTTDTVVCLGRDPAQPYLRSDARGDPGAARGQGESSSMRLQVRQTGGVSVHLPYELPVAPLRCTRRLGRKLQLAALSCASGGSWWSSFGFAVEQAAHGWLFYAPTVRFGAEKARAMSGRCKVTESSFVTCWHRSALTM